MKRFNRAFVKRVRRRVARTVRTAPKWKKQAKGSKRPFDWTRDAAMRAIVPCLIVAGFSWEVFPLTLLTAFFSIWLFALTLLRAHDVAVLSGPTGELWPLLHMPLSNREVFLIQQRRILLTSCWTVVDAATFFGCLAWLHGSGQLIIAAVVIATLFQWAFLLVIAIQLARRWPFLPYGTVGYCLALGLFFGAMLLMKFQTLPGAVETAAEAVLVFLPNAWINALVLGLLEPLWLKLWPLALPAAAGAVALPWIVSRFSSSFRVQALFEPREEVLTREVEAAQNEDATLALHREQLRQALDRGSRPETLPPAWLEKAILTTLAPRQRILAAFLLPLPPSWTREWLYGTLTMAVVWTYLLLAVHLDAVPFSREAVIIGAGLSFLVSIPLLGGTWPGAGGIFHPDQPARTRYIALAPLRLRSVIPMIAQVNSLRLLAAWPLSVLGFLAGWEEISPADALFWGTKVIAALVLLQPLIASFPFMSTERSARNRLSFYVIEGAATVVLLGALAAAGFFVWQTDLLLLMLLAPVVLILAIIPTALSSWAYERGVFDLAPPQ